MEELISSLENEARSEKQAELEAFRASQEEQVRGTVAAKLSDRVVSLRQRVSDIEGNLSVARADFDSAVAAHEKYTYVPSEESQG